MDLLIIMCYAYVAHDAKRDLIRTPIQNNKRWERSKDRPTRFDNFKVTVNSTVTNQ